MAAGQSNLTMLARLGFAARGLVYLLVGWFAIDAARHGGAPGDNRAALESLADGGLGRALLGVIAFGLIGYAIWRLSEAWFDPEDEGHDLKGTIARGGHAISGVVHIALAFVAARLALGERGGGGDQASEGAAMLMAQPAGVWLVGLFGLLLLGGAAGNFLEAYRAKFARYMGGGEPAPGYVKLAGRIGYAARGVVFTMIAWFFVRAALAANPERAGGTGEALRELQSQDYGPLLLGIVALGLLLFGVFSLIEARYRQLRVVSPI